MVTNWLGQQLLECYTKSDLQQQTQHALWSTTAYHAARLPQQTVRMKTATRKLIISFSDYVNSITTSHFCLIWEFYGFTDIMDNMDNIPAPLYFRTLWRYKNCIIIIIISLGSCYCLDTTVACRMIDW